MTFFKSFLTLFYRETWPGSSLSSRRAPRQTCHGRGANLRPPAPQADALPKELSSQLISWLFGTSTWPSSMTTFGPLHGRPSSYAKHMDLNWEVGRIALASDAPWISGGQTPWLNGRPADIDSISDQWSKFRNIAIFRKKFRKGLNQNIDQKADIWSKPSKIVIFCEKNKRI